jgi:uncharacterized delta-60 repeat protein
MRQTVMIHNYQDYRLVFCAFSVILCAALYAPLGNAQECLWTRVFDTGQEDRAAGVAVSSGGNIIIAGTTIPGEIEPNDHGDFLVIKYDPSGDTLWTRRFDTGFNDNSSEDASDIAIDRTEDVVVVGSLWRYEDGSRFCVVKYNPSGDSIWTRTFRISGMERAHAVAIDSKGNIVVTGEGHSTQQTYSDYLTAKYDRMGALLWVRWYDGGWEDVAQDVAVDASDNIIVTGYSDSNLNWDWCTVKYSPDGDTLWVRRQDAALTDWAFGVSTDMQDGVIVVGETHYFYPGSGGSTGMVVKYTPNGDTLWTRLFTDTLQHSEVSKLVGVATDNDDNIYLAGQYASWDTSGRLSSDYFVAKCAPNGDTLWTTRCDYGSEDTPGGMGLDDWENVVVSGTTNGSHMPYALDFFTVKLRGVVNGVDNNFPGTFLIYPNYPNPFNASTTISYEMLAPSFVILKVFDLLGREVAALVAEEEERGSYTVVWRPDKFPSGIYMARLTAGGSTGSLKLLLVK